MGLIKLLAIQSLLVDPEELVCCLLQTHVLHLHPESSLTAPILTPHHLLDTSEGLSHSSGTSGLRYKLAPHNLPPSTLLFMCHTSISCTTSSLVGTPVSLRFPPQSSLKITTQKAYWLSLRRLCILCLGPRWGAHCLLPSAIKACTSLLFLSSPVSSSHRSEISKQESLFISLLKEGPLIPRAGSFSQHDILGLPLFVCGWVVIIAAVLTPGCTQCSSPAQTVKPEPPGGRPQVMALCSPGGTQPAVQLPTALAIWSQCTSVVPQEAPNLS